MIRHEPWYIQADSRQVEEAIARLERGDENAIPDILRAYERGVLAPNFQLMNVMINRHKGISPRWIYVVSRLPSPPATKTWERLWNAMKMAYKPYENLRGISVDISVDAAYGNVPKDREWSDRYLVDLWRELDDVLLPEIERTWEDFMEERPEAADDFSVKYQEYYGTPLGEHLDYYPSPKR